MQPFVVRKEFTISIFGKKLKKQVLVLNTDTIALHVAEDLLIEDATEEFNEVIRTYLS